MDLKARIYIGIVIAAGATTLGLTASEWKSSHPGQFLLYLIVTLFASGLKVTLPGVSGTMSVYFVFLLIGVLQLTLGENLILAIGASFVQCYWKARRRPLPVQVAFNVASTSLATLTAYHAFRWPYARSFGLENTALLGIAAVAFFLANTAPVAVVIALTEGKSPRRVWRDCYFWCFPYYLIGASIAGLFDYSSRRFGWENSLLGLPVIYLIYRSYRLYLGRLQSEKEHAQQMASLHLRTIEALALAIDAKDQTTHEHLQRVQVYAMAIGRELGICAEELEALQAASLLHDIGKLAVPEHIISKPGKLTPEEFEKMKIHPVVGAEILEQVQFPYPVAPIVRSHHEKWNGEGYPDGLKGEAIPIGARILSAVDCLDALASDRQYRRALPLDQALAVVISESGRSYDPRVVEILARRCQEFEEKAGRGTIVSELAKLSTAVKVDKGQAPATGFAAEGRAQASADQSKPVEFLTSIASARQEVQSLFELAQDLGQSLSLNETLSVVASRLRRMIPFDGLALWMLRDETLVPEYVTGEDQQLFLSLEIPLGQGLSGWVAENRRPILNGNPSVEPGYLNDPSRFSKLNSALAVPLESPNALLGVLALYQSGRDAFTRDQLRILMAVSAKLAVSIENARRFEEAETSATTDYLTGLPNARSLFLHLDAEISRCRRAASPLSILVCDLDGFKGVNDRFGHLAGNRLLNLVGAGLREKSRAYDYVARMGGDEFVVVLPGLARETLERKKAEYEDVAVQAGQVVCGERLLSISIGDAALGADGHDAEELLAEADRRMYRLKQARRRPRLEAVPFGQASEPKVVNA